MSLWGELGPVGLLVLDVDGVLFDTRPSFYAAARIACEEAGGALSDGDIAAFKAIGGWNDDWEMARAAAAIARWRARTGDATALAELLTRGKALPGVLAWADDPGDLASRCEALYADLSEREIALVSPDLLREVGRRVELAACTGRTRPQADDAFARLGVTVPTMTTCEIARKPDPGALTRLLDGRPALFVGDTVDDLRTALGARERGADVRFAWALEADATEADAARVRSLGADIACAGIDPLLRAILRDLPERNPHAP